MERAIPILPANDLSVAKGSSISVTLRIVLVLLGVASTAAVAQRIDVTVTREPSRGGSFAATLAGGTSGALVGLLAGVGFASFTMGDCITGGDCDDTAGPTVLFVAGTTVVGAAGGAWIGRRLSGGRQSPVGSLLGATVGLLAAGLLATQLHPDSAVPGALTISIPTGLFATLGGW